MSPTPREKHTNASQRRRHTAAERLQRDRRQAQHAAKVLEQALDDLGIVWSKNSNTALWQELCASLA